MGISVCVPSVRATTVRYTIETILRQDYEEWELLVVVQGVRPEAKAVAEEYARRDPRIRCVHIPQMGASRARNAGAAAAKYELISLTDDDCVPATDWLRVNAVYFAEDPDLAVLWGSLVAPPRRRWSLSTCPECIVHDLMFDPKSGQEPPSLMEYGSSNMTARKSVFQEVQFDEHLGPGTAISAGEDVDYMERLVRQKFRIRFSPRSVVHHTYGTRTGLRSVLALKVSYGLGVGANVGKQILYSPSAGEGWRKAEWEVSVAKRARRGSLLGLPRGLFRYYLVKKGVEMVVDRFLLNEKGLLVEKLEGA